jgi:hypothetical protein
MKQRQVGEVSLTIIFLAAALALFSYHKPAALPADANSCCHAPTQAAHNTLVTATHAQDPGQEEEGNPSHTRPKRSCNHKPAANQVQCHCVTDCGGNGTPREDRRCKSFCYKDMCSCPRKPCP